MYVYMYRISGIVCKSNCHSVHEKMFASLVIHLVIIVIQLCKILQEIGRECTRIAKSANISFVNDSQYTLCMYVHVKKYVVKYSPIKWSPFCNLT